MFILKTAKNSLTNEYIFFAMVEIGEYRFHYNRRREMSQQKLVHTHASLAYMGSSALRFSLRC